MKGMESKIIGSLLNESMTTPEVVAEPEVGVNRPAQVHQCDNCAEFYLVQDAANESVCPFCGETGTPVGDIKDLSEDEDDDDLTPSELNEEEEEELKSEADAIIDEALKLLDRNDFTKFNEGYRPRLRINRKGELEALVESTNGGFVTSSKRMTTRQKSAYKLSEKYKPSNKVAAPKKNTRLESIRLKRQTLLIKNESRATKLAAAKILERQGVKYDFKKFNESMNEFIKGRDVKSILEEISSETEMGKSELDEMTPTEIEDQVTEVLEDTGLDVITNDVEIDGDTATVSVRVEDNNGIEVHANEVEEVLEDVFNAPVEIVGPFVSEGDDDVVDLVITINPEDNVNEEDEENTDNDLPLEEGDDPLNPEDDQTHLDEENEDACPVCGQDPCICKNESIKKRRNESVKKRGRRKNESFVQGVGETPLFALRATDSADNEVEFLAHDDSLVSGNEANAEELARVFVSEEAAAKFIQDSGLEGQFEPVSISIVKNECDATDPEKALTEGDSEDMSFESEGEKYYVEEGMFYKEDENGDVEEISESEFMDAKASSEEEAELKESYKKRRGNRK